MGRAGRRLRAMALGLGLCLVLGGWAPGPAAAAGLIRDAEIEQVLRSLAQPLARAAGVSGARLRVLLINDPRPNAFVVDGQTILIHAGLMARLETAPQMQAVLAHELAHIANGHLARRAANQRGARSTAAMGLALSAAVAATGNAQAGAGLALGTSSSARRAFLAHTRAEEAAADETGLHILADAGADPGAMEEVLSLFAGQEALSSGRQDPYVRTHPLSADRLRAVRAGAAALPAGRADGAAEATAQAYARARLKLAAFLDPPRHTLARLEGDASPQARMARAVALHRQPDRAAARAEIAALVQDFPQDAFLHELAGQIALESGDVEAAIAYHGQAVVLAEGQKRQPLPRAQGALRAGLGLALLARGTPEDLEAARTALEAARLSDPFDPRALRGLAMAHARLGAPALAALATAERYALLGRFEDARINANRALGLLRPGSPAARRAEDVLDTAKAALGR